MRPEGHFYLETRTINILWMGCLGLVIIFFFMLIFEALDIERELKGEITHILESEGYHRTSVEVAGRDVYINGEVSSSQSVERVRRIAGKVEGVRVVLSRLDLVPLRVSHIRIKRQEGLSWRISGELPSRLNIEQIGRETGLSPESLLGTDHDLKVEPEVTDPVWLPLIGTALRSSEGIEQFELEIGAFALTVQGKVPSVALYAAKLAVFQQLANKYRLRLINRLATLPKSSP